jgi:DNA-binding MarR family transcriptional regulator
MSDILDAGGARQASAQPERFSPEHVRELFHRKTMAGERHRAAVAQLLGMDATEAAALAHLAQHGQLTPGDLGRLLGLTSGGTTALIQRLVDAGNLTRRPHPRDKRSSLLAASESMLERAEKLYAPLVEAMNELTAQLADPERASIGRYLTDVVQLSERHAERLQDLVRSDQHEDVAPPAPGLWA